jgi:hypothetical protein
MLNHLKLQLSFFDHPNIRVPYQCYDQSNLFSHFSSSLLARRQIFGWHVWMSMLDNLNYFWAFWSTLILGCQSMIRQKYYFFISPVFYLLKSWVEWPYFDAESFLIAFEVLWAAARFWESFVPILFIENWLFPQLFDTYRLFSLKFCNFARDKRVKTSKTQHSLNQLSLPIRLHHEKNKIICCNYPKWKSYNSLSFSNQFMLNNIPSSGMFTHEFHINATKCTLLIWIFHFDKNIRLQYSNFNFKFSAVSTIWLGLNVEM